MNRSTDPSLALSPASLPGKSWQRHTVLFVAGASLVGAGLAAGLWMRASGPAAEVPQAAATAAPAATVAAPAAKGGSPAPQSASRGTPLETQPAANVCANCGVVEGVRAVQQKGEGTGLGAVAGGVLGGVLGHQVGGGNGKKAMTVIGAVGGGLAGHEVEKRARAQTVYEVRVRLDDGTLRTLTQRSAPAPGARVVVEGSSLRVVSADEAPRTVRVSAPSGA